MPPAPTGPREHPVAIALGVALLGVALAAGSRHWLATDGNTVQRALRAVPVGADPCGGDGATGPRIGTPRVFVGDLHERHRRETVQRVSLWPSGGLARTTDDRPGEVTTWCVLPAVARRWIAAPAADEASAQAAIRALRDARSEPGPAACHPGRWCALTWQELARGPHGGVMQVGTCTLRLDGSFAGASEAADVAGRVSPAAAQRLLETLERLADTRAPAEVADRSRLQVQVGGRSGDLDAVFPRAQEFGEAFARRICRHR